MMEVRSSEADLQRFRFRAAVMSIVVLLAFCLIVARLLVLQVERHEELAERAESNRTAVVPIVPNRGLIVDRNGVPRTMFKPDDGPAYWAQQKERAPTFGQRRASSRSAE